MKHIGLFAGIGGFELAAQWMGWETIAWCEINPFCQTVLKYHFPNAKAHRDIKATDFSIYRGQCDLLTGGFPCQPYSVAGQRKGTADDRHLWPEMLRAIREIQPTWIVGENVSGLISWDAGMVFNQVQADLEAEGYEVTPFLLPACAINAPHRRDRIWFVAYSGCRQLQRNGKHGELGCPQSPNKGNGNQWERLRDAPGNICKEVHVANTCSTGLSKPSCRKQRKVPKQVRTCQGGESCRTDAAVTGWQSFPTQSPVCNGNDGLSSRLAGITFSKHRNESIKGGGNAIVPQVALQIYKAIEQYQQ